MSEDDKPRSFPLLVFALPVLVVALHIPYLKLPFHWDELGQFVPAALDIFREGRWVPRTTLPNVHPPGIMFVLAGVWKAFGYSIVSSRLTILAIAALGIWLTFRLTLRLAHKAEPAYIAALLLIVTPIFYTQSMMVLLDMPAMTLTLAALVLFLDRRFLICAAVCTCLVLIKETAITAPAVFALWLWFKERLRAKALLFFIPAVALGLWLATLRHETGNWLGNQEFARYNVSSALEPFHILFAFLSRAWFLFIADGRFLGTLALFAGWNLLRRTEWTLAFLVAGAQLLVVTVFGGAELERYLVPVLPILYAAMATAAGIWSPPTRLISQAAMLAICVAGWFWSTPFPWPYEDNLDMVDFIRLHQSAARYLEDHAVADRIATAWPLSDELLHPEFGYVNQPLRALKAPDLHIAGITSLGPGNFDLLVMFTNQRRVKGSLLDIPLLRSFLQGYYDYEPQASEDEIRMAIGFVPVKRWQRGDQWIEIYAPRSQ
jgi:4-amino-4-deoxy-L-arabinose transferase-like glycosyltransferase